MVTASVRIKVRIRVRVRVRLGLHLDIRLCHDPQVWVSHLALQRPSERLSTKH